MMKQSVKNFLIDTAKGAGIGLSMIIPGVSGGTLAVIFNIYEKIIDAINSLRKEFKKSVLTLLPILIGAVASLLIASVPIRYALEHAPIPTILLFTGLMIGSCPNIFKTGLKHGFSKFDIIAVIVPFAVVIGICFISGSGDVNLSESMKVYMWFLLFLIGILASCALVVPGISGSMLLLITGFYNPVTACLTLSNSSAGHSILILLVFGVGLIVGFFTISKIMKLLLVKFPRGTRWAIIGFAFGSIPAIFVTYRHDFSGVTLAHMFVGIVLCLLGAAATYFLTYALEKREKEKAASESGENPEGISENTDYGNEPEEISENGESTTDKENESSPEIHENDNN